MVSRHQSPISVSQSGENPRRNVFCKSGTRPAIAVIVAGTLAVPASAQAPSPTPAPASTNSCPGYTVCPIVNFQDVIANDPDARRVNNGITRTETQTLNEILAGQYSSDPNAPNSAKSILGKVMIYDRNLSVNGLVACATCHTPQEGFTGGVSLLNNTTVSFPGAIGDRASGRKPMAYSYAPFAPVQFYRASTGDFVGGNFWDERATGLVTGNPAGDQALGPPLNPVEMANPDAACVDLSPVAVGIPLPVRAGLGRTEFCDHLACRHGATLRSAGGFDDQRHFDGSPLVQRGPRSGHHDFRQHGPRDGQL